MSLQDRYDDAMFDFSTGNFEAAIVQLHAILVEDPDYFDARLSLGMAHYRTGDYAAALAEGHQAEQLRPDDQLVHTNLSLFYLKNGDKLKAEQHGLKARIASWKKPSPPPGDPGTDPELQTVKPPPRPMPPQPWKNGKNP
jgi:Flp pilus assembly protein TadD